LSLDSSSLGQNLSSIAYVLALTYKVIASNLEIRIRNDENFGNYPKLHLVASCASVIRLELDPGLSTAKIGALIDNLSGATLAPAILLTGKCEKVTSV
jgi:hypothetical protein